MRTEEGSSKAQEGYLIAKTLRSFEMIGECGEASARLDAQNQTPPVVVIAQGLWR